MGGKSVSRNIKGEDMNKQGAGKIDYCDYTWNPIGGCLHACPYCYMMRMEKRFPGIMKPKFHPKRLSQPMSVKKPSVIFTGSSGDGWGGWVDSEHIDDVLDVCTVFATQHTYLFLTKNPKRYGDFRAIENGWYGTTDDGTNRTQNNIRELCLSVNAQRRFVSFEPLLNCVEPNLSGIQWVIIGADSTRGAAKPPKEWADTIIEEARRYNIPVWIKDNYHFPLRIKEKP